MRVLVTNDDGIDGPGMHALARAVVKDGHDVVVVAPMVDMSGSGAAVGPVDLSRGVVMERRLADMDGVAAYAVDGPPALGVRAALSGAFGAAPEVVVSGVNPGLNIGRSVLHSGTVGAALTAALAGAPAVAVSQAAGDPWLVETAAVFAAAAAAWLAGRDDCMVLSLNVPNLALEDVAGVRAAELAPFGTVRAALGPEADGRRQLVLRDVEEPLDAGTDSMVVRRGFVAVTALVGVRAEDPGHAPAALEADVLGSR